MLGAYWETLMVRGSDFYICFRCAGMVTLRDHVVFFVCVDCRGILADRLIGEVP